MVKITYYRDRPAVSLGDFSPFLQKVAVTTETIWLQTADLPIPSASSICQHANIIEEDTQVTRRQTKSVIARNTCSNGKTFALPHV